MVDEFYSPVDDDQTQDESETDKPKEIEIEETKDSGDANNTEEQKKLSNDWSQRSRIRMDQKPNKRNDVTKK